MLLGTEGLPDIPPLSPSNPAGEDDGVFILPGLDFRYVLT